MLRLLLEIYSTNTLRELFLSITVFFIHFLKLMSLQTETLQNETYDFYIF